MSDIIHVAVAAIVNKDNKVCISLRHTNSHQGGLWEFPGGKVEEFETTEQALAREMQEELGLEVVRSRPLITVNHKYQDEQVTVFLDVRKVISYKGEAVGREGQEVRWVDVDDLSGYDFPEANVAIIKALQLPDKYLITGKFIDSNDFLVRLKSALSHDIRLVQLRLKDNDLKDLKDVQSLVEKTSLYCQQANARLMLNLAPSVIESVDLSSVIFDGLHADSHTLGLLSTGELSQSLKGEWLSASCHNQQQLQQAIKLQADFVVLSPVQKTASHPELPAMGWKTFSSMIKDIAMPVYALGGVKGEDVERSWSCGAQGVAAISAFWK